MPSENSTRPSVWLCSNFDTISMEILEAVKDRRSIRSFQDKAIPQEVIDNLIDSLIWAPSAGNLQSRKFFFVREPALKKKIAVAALNQEFITEAPIVVVCCADGRIYDRYGDRGVTLYTIQDVATSIMNMMLVAHENSLGTVWIGAFNEGDVFNILDLPYHLRPVAIVPVGYPVRIPSSPPRCSRREAVEFR